MQNPHSGSKITIPEKHVKIYSTKHIQLFCAKKPLKKNTKYSRKETILNIGHHFGSKWSQLGITPAPFPLGQRCPRKMAMLKKNKKTKMSMLEYLVFFAQSNCIYVE